MITSEWCLAEPAGEHQIAAEQKVGTEQNIQAEQKVRAAWLFRDLVAIHGEFPELSIDLEKRTMTVQTEPIELEEVFLGSFAIRLHWQVERSYEERCERPHYRIVPLEKTASRSMPEVCHPHVSNNSLCEGDAGSAIRTAWRDGRLHDLFLVISRVLETYNPDSPFVHLCDWDSGTCDDCGDLSAEGEICSCQHCGNELCSECVTSCAGCDDSACSSCLEECEHCGSCFCDSCFAACRECNKPTCQDCLVEELCDDCEAKKQAEDCQAESQPKQASGQATEAKV
ncbi:hypothetical protein SH139x_005345 [Planctomycetaceae bacterium SH139]